MIRLRFMLKASMLKSEWSAVGLFGLALVIVVTAALSPTWEAVWLTLVGQTAAAWVQAIGVFLAIYLTGRQAVQLSEKNSQLREAANRAERIAIAEQLVRLLLPQINALRDQAAIRDRLIAGFPDTWRPGNMQRFPLDIPKRLEDAAFSMKADHRTFADVGEIVIAAHSYNAFIQIVAAVDLNEHGESTFRATMQDRRQAVVENCNKVLGIFG